MGGERFKCAFNDHRTFCRTMRFNLVLLAAWLFSAILAPPVAGAGRGDCPFDKRLELFVHWEGTQAFRPQARLGRQVMPRVVKLLQKELTEDLAFGLGWFANPPTYNDPNDECFNLESAISTDMRNQTHMFYQMESRQIGSLTRIIGTYAMMAHAGGYAAGFSHNSDKNAVRVLLTVTNMGALSGTDPLEGLPETVECKLIDNGLNILRAPLGQVAEILKEANVFPLTMAYNTSAAKWDEQFADPEWDFPDGAAGVIQLQPFDDVDAVSRQIVDEIKAFACQVVEIPTLAPTEAPPPTSEALPTTEATSFVPPSTAPTEPTEPTDGTESPPVGETEEEQDNTGLYIGLGVGLGLAALLIALASYFLLFRRERQPQGVVAASEAPRESRAVNAVREQGIDFTFS